MKSINNSIIAIALGCLAALAQCGTLQAADEPRAMSLTPMTGPGVTGKQFLLNLRVGMKQTISYFQNVDGQCKLTVMVADAYDGENVPTSSAVRFEVAIDAGRAARMDTAEGKALEYACEPNAREMNVKALDQMAGYPPGT